MADRWSRPLRLVQFLLRNADAEVESPERLVDAAADWGANAVLLNAGGFSAWYPTQLAYQQTNPHLQGDFFGTALAQAHRRGLRMIARMDVSKTHPDVAASHPDWLRLDTSGAVSTEWEMPETCFSGDYWQRCNFEILDELLTTYPDDGVFYNMYRVAHCHCSRCQDVLRSQGSAGVPSEANPADPAWRDYELWRRRALVGYTERVRDFVHERRPDVALLVYHHQKEGWDVPGIARASDLVSVTASLPLAVNPESPQPAWIGWPGYEAALARGLKPDRPGVVVTTTSALFASRRAAQPPDRLQAALLQVAFQRGGACPAIPGGLRQDDPRALPAIAEGLGWLARNEAAFEGLESPARIALLTSRDTLDLCPIRGEGELSRREERGVYLALTGACYPFDIVPLDHHGPDLSRYDVGLLPDIACLSVEDAAAIDRWVEAGGTLIATYLAGQFDEHGEVRHHSPLSCLGRPEIRATLDTTGGYLAVSQEELRTALAGTEIIGVERELLDVAGGPAERDDLHLLGPVRNNTPEFAQVPPRVGPPGLLGWRFGKGRGWYVPWRPGVLVSQVGLRDPASVLIWLVARTAGPPPVSLSAPQSVEARFWLQPTQNRAVLFLLNAAALQTTPFAEVVPTGMIDLRLRVDVARVRSLTRGQEIPHRQEADGIRFTLPALEAFEALQFDLV